MKILNLDKKNSRVVELISLDACLVNGGKCRCFCGHESNYLLDAIVKNEIACEKTCDDFFRVTARCEQITEAEEELLLRQSSDLDPVYFSDQSSVGTPTASLW